MKNDIEQILVSKKEIDIIVKRIADELTVDYADKNPVLIGLLKGCVMFMSDVSKCLDFNLELDYMDVSSYNGVSSTGVVTIDRDLKTDIVGRDIIIMEDIVDTGRTLTKVKELLINRGAKSVKVATLLDKPEGRIVELEAEYVGISVPNHFVVGYGLDYNERYRNLPYIGILKEKIYKK